MNNDRLAILSLIAAGRISPAQAERLLAACNESRENLWILAVCLTCVCLAQLHLHELLPGLAHFLSAQIPAWAAAAQHAISPENGLWGGML
jgi:hypothetical protein